MEDEARTLRMRRIGVLQVIDPPAIHGRSAAYHAVHLVAFPQEKLGQI
jgi:uncharacterized membrane protein